MALKTGAEKQSLCPPSHWLQSRRDSSLIGCHSSKWYRNPVRPFFCPLQTPPIILWKNSDSGTSFRGPQPSKAVAIRYDNYHHQRPFSAPVPPLPQPQSLQVSLASWDHLLEALRRAMDWNEYWGHALSGSGLTMPYQGRKPRSPPYSHLFRPIWPTTGWVASLWCKCEILLLFLRVFLLSLWTYFRLVLSYRTQAKTPWT